MKVDLQYVSDQNGQTRAIIMPLAEWEKIVQKMKRYEQALRLKEDLKEAIAEVKSLKKRKEKKQTLNDFLHEL